MSKLTMMAKRLPTTETLLSVSERMKGRADKSIAFCPDPEDPERAKIPDLNSPTPSIAEERMITTRIPYTSKNLISERMSSSSFFATELQPAILYTLLNT